MTVRNHLNPSGRWVAGAGRLATLFAKVPDRLPRPAMDAPNAAAHLRWRYPAEGRPVTGWYSIQFEKRGGATVKIGSRTLVELLAGRVDSKTFLQQNRYFGLGTDESN